MIIYCTVHPPPPAPFVFFATFSQAVLKITTLIQLIASPLPFNTWTISYFELPTSQKKKKKKKKKKKEKKSDCREIQNDSDEVRFFRLSYFSQKKKKKKNAVNLGRVEQ